MIADIFVGLGACLLLYMMVSFVWEWCKLCSMQDDEWDALLSEAEENGVDEEGKGR